MEQTDEDMNRREEWGRVADWSRRKSLHHTHAEEFTTEGLNSSNSNTGSLQSCVCQGVLLLTVDTGLSGCKPGIKGWGPWGNNHHWTTSKRTFLSSRFHSVGNKTDITSPPGSLGPNSGVSALNDTTVLIQNQCVGSFDLQMLDLFLNLDDLQGFVPKDKAGDLSS